MSKFLIEVPHDPDIVACAKVVKVFLETGSHFLTNADWGCADGHHSAWLLVDMANKDEARAILPAAFRADAKIIGLNRFEMEYIDSILANHR
jgi:hypothetical protein